MLEIPSQVKRDDDQVQRHEKPEAQPRKGHATLSFGALALNLVLGWARDRAHPALIFPARPKIGKYMATSTTPTTAPMLAMSTGSMRLVSDEMATSTSSS